jgi:hypothetical protein
MELEFFRHNILPPDNYAVSRSDPAGLRIPYMLVYDTFSAICMEQQGIVENHKDATVLSAVFTRLPRLTELGLCFVRLLPKSGGWHF